MQDLTVDLQSNFSVNEELFECLNDEAEIFPCSHSNMITLRDPSVVLPHKEPCVSLGLYVFAGGFKDCVSYFALMR